MPKHRQRVVRTGGFRRKAGEAADGFRAHVFVGIRPRHFGEHAPVVEARDRRAAHARVRIVFRKRVERVAVGGAELEDG